jgi:hypothetical protein
MPPLAGWSWADAAGPPRERGGRRAPGPCREDAHVAVLWRWREKRSDGWVQGARVRAGCRKRETVERAMRRQERISTRMPSVGTLVGCPSPSRRERLYRAKRGKRGRSPGPCTPDRSPALRAAHAQMSDRCRDAARSGDCPSRPASGQGRGARQRRVPAPPGPCSGCDHAAPAARLLARARRWWPPGRACPGSGRYRAPRRYHSSSESLRAARGRGSAAEAGCPRLPRPAAGPPATPPAAPCALATAGHARVGRRRTRSMAHSCVRVRGQAPVVAGRREGRSAAALRGRSESAAAARGRTPPRRARPAPPPAVPAHPWRPGVLRRRARVGGVRRGVRASAVAGLGLPAAATEHVAASRGALATVAASRGALATTPQNT